MIIELKKNISKETIENLANKHRAFHIFDSDKNFLITSASIKELDNELSPYAENQWVFAICNYLRESSKKQLEKLS